MDSLKHADITDALLASIKNPDTQKLLVGATIALVLIRTFGLWPQKKDKILARIPGYPIIGNLPLLLPSSTSFTNITKAVKKYGKFIELSIMGGRAIVISDVKIVKEIMSKRPKLFRRTKALEVPASLFGFGPHSGLFFAEGDPWARQRRLSSPAFSNKNTELMGPAIAKEIDNFMARLKSFGVGEVIRMDHQAFFYTIRVISAVAFGDVDKERAEYFFTSAIIADIHSIFDFFLQRLLFPLPAWLWYFSSSYHTEKAGAIGDARFSANCLHMITEARKRIASAEYRESSTSKSLIESLIGTKIGSDAPLSDGEILSNVKTFYLGGADTTSVILSWCVYQLCIDKVMLKRIQAEVDGVLSLEMTGKEAMAATPLLPYCAAIFKEVLRLKTPIVTLMMGLVGTDTVTLSNGIQIHKNNELFLHLESVMRDPDVFDDPDAFNPSRWLVTEQSPAKLFEMESTFMAFGFGPRVCPGQALAVVEGVAALAAIVRNFNFEIGCPIGEIERICDFVTKINKLPLILEKRLK